MGYLSIKNIYRSQEIFLFNECYCLEKVHGTSAHIGWNKNHLTFFSGGATHNNFIALFDHEKLQAYFKKRFNEMNVVIYGEAYGGKIQHMSDTYGKELRFIVFDIKIENMWLDVEKMDQLATNMGFEVVPWVKVPARIEYLDAERDKPSEVAVRRDMGTSKLREGVVVHPPIELTTNNGERIIAKHKGAAFSERVHQPAIMSSEELTILEAANAIAEEWATFHRLEHVTAKILAGRCTCIENLITNDECPVCHRERKSSQLDIADMRTVIGTMIKDIFREAKGEIVESKQAMSAIGRQTALLFKKYLNQV